MFQDWDRVAGVRSSPRRIFRDERDAGFQLFPSAELPYLRIIDEELPVGKVDYLLAQRLYEYLNFTLHLEVRIVNRALLTLSYADVGIDLSDEMRLDAYRIYTDEAYHAMFTLDMIQQVAKETGITPLPYNFTVLDALDEAASDVEALAPGLAHLLQATVFETTITSILASIPHDSNVVTAVRELIADHSADERRHHAYFARLFPAIWSNCGTPTRRAAGRYLAQAVAQCLAPDIKHAGVMLAASGIPAERADAVLDSVFTPAAVAARNRHMARHTLRLLAVHGVLDDPAVRHSFAARSLLDPCGDP